MARLLSVLAVLCLLLAVGCSTSNLPNSGTGGSPKAALSVGGVSPTTLPVSAAATLTVTGTGFTASTAVLVNGTVLPTTFVSSTQLTAAVAAGQFVSAGAFSVSVSDGGATSSASAPVEFDDPQPSITGLNPASAIVGAGSMDVVVTGSGFVPNTAVQVNGANRPTAFTSASALKVTLTLADLASTGSLAVATVNPAPGGGTSAAISFPVNNPAPGPVTVSPSTLNAGGASDLPFVVSGANFVPSSVVLVDGTARTTRFLSSTQLGASLTTAEQAGAHSFQVAVLTPAPGGGTSPATTLAVINPAPVAVSVNPATAITGSTTDLPFVITGSNFVASSVVLVDGNVRTTRFLSGTQLGASLSAAEQAAPHTFQITVQTPAPGGGSSAAVTLPVVNPVPGPIAVNPSAVDAGSSADLPISITGTNFVSSSMVQVNGVSRATTFLSNTQLGASLTVAELASGNVFQIAVFTPTPGGGTSAAVPLTVRANPVPVLTSVSPTSIVAGSSPVLDVVGSGFIPSSAITWNGSALKTKYLSATELNATVDPTLTAAAGSATIGVTNPPPIGGVSAVMTVPIISAVPTLTSFFPAAVFHSSTSTTITVQGTGFQTTSSILWNGTPYPTTFVSGTQLSATVPQAAVPSTSDTASLQVATPAPGGGTSASLTVPVYAVQPQITAVQENVTGTVCQQIQLFISGHNFPSGNAVLRLNGSQIASQNTGNRTLLFTILPANLGIISNPQLTVEAAGSPGDISAPFALTPAAATCYSPATVVAYPGTTLGINATDTALGTSAVTVSGLSLPPGFTAPTASPYPLPSRIFVAVDPSVAAGSYAFGLTTGGGASSTATLPVVVESRTPSFSFSSGLGTDLAVPVGGSTTFTLQTLANVDGNGTPDFRITLGAAGLPQGVSATFQPAAILPGDSATVTLTATKEAPLRQNVPISVVGTVDGSSASASAAYTLSVARVPGTIPDNRTAFTWTGGTPSSLAFDRVHNLIFASNAVWNRVDVISASSHALLRSIPVASPVMVDLTQDSNTLWIATQSEQVFALSTTDFTTQRYSLPAIPSSSNTWTVSEMHALADGSLLLSVGDYDSGYIWSPGGTALKAVHMARPLLRTGDGTKVFGLESGFSGCILDSYSTASGSATTYTIDSGFTGSSFCGTLEASNADGSILVTNLTAASLQGVQLINSTGQSLGSFTAALKPGTLGMRESVSFFPQTFVFSDDGQTLYQTGSRTPGGSLIATYDVPSRKLLGLAPAIGLGGNTALVAADGSGLLIGIQNGGVAFEDSTYFQDYGTGSAPLSGGEPSSFVPQGGPLTGDTTFTLSSYIELLPDVWFGDSRGTTSLAANAVSLTSPATQSAGPVDLKLIYPNGELGYAALGFSYGATPESMLYNGSAPAGGAPSTVTGFGLPVDSSSGSLTVGGTSASITSVVGQYPPFTGEAVPSTYVNFTLPPGKPGYADLQVTTPKGSGTLSKAVFYASSVSDYSFSGTASAVIYDKFRKQAYVITKTAVLVFSPASGGFQSPLSVPTVHGTFDLHDGALSTDGTYLVIGNGADASVAVLNLTTPAQSYALALPTLSLVNSTCTFGPGAVAALAGSRALVLPTPSSSQCGIFSKAAVVDLQARTQVPATYSYGCFADFFNPQMQSTADGTLAVVGTGGDGDVCFYDSTKGFSSAGSVSAYFTAAISADGNILAGDLHFANSAGTPLGVLAQPPALYGNALSTTYPASPQTTMLHGSHFNAAGSLFYVPHAAYFEIIDTASATLKMRFSLTQTMQAVLEPLAIDEGGRYVFLLTGAGLTVVDLGEAPLSVGHLGPTQPVSGGTIQLRGSGFDSGTTVTVDATTAVATVVDENTLSVVLPPLKTGAHNLVLNRADGSTVTVRGLITVP